MLPDPNEQQLITAVQSQDFSAVRTLMQRGIQQNKKFANDTTALIYAARNNDKQIVQLLLDFGANPNAEDNSKRTPLIEASEKDAEITKLLLANGANPDMQALGGTSVLMLSTYFSNSETMKLLIKANANVNLQDACGKTALLWGWGAKTECLQIIIDAGADLNSQDQTGRTALMWAIQGGAEDTVRILLKAGANTSIADRSGYTALDIARSIEDLNFFEDILIKHEADTASTENQEKKRRQESHRTEYKQTRANRQRNFRDFIRKGKTF